MEKLSERAVGSVVKYFVVILILFLLLCFYSADQQAKREAEEVAYAAIIQEKTVNELAGRGYRLSSEFSGEESKY